MSALLFANSTRAISWHWYLDDAYDAGFNAVCPYYGRRGNRIAEHVKRELS